MQEECVKTVNNNVGRTIEFRKTYEVVPGVLGHGAFGGAVLLRDQDTGMYCVAKQYEPLPQLDKVKFFSLFQREVKLLFGLNHINVVRVYDCHLFPEEYSGFIIMEYIDGETVDKYLSRSDLTASQLGDIFVQLIDAFKYIETCKVIHRDIRESNIMITKTGVVKLIDFGLGKVCSANSAFLQMDSLKNQINRQAVDLLPEEYDTGVYTSLTDMFYLGELMHRLVKKNPICADIFPYNDIVEKMMQKKICDRFSSFDEIRDVLAKSNHLDVGINDEGKAIYQAFADCLFGILVCYLEAPRYYDWSTMINRLERLVQQNSLEADLQSNVDFLSCFISSNYRYYPNKKVSVNIVGSFVKWIKHLGRTETTAVFNNLMNRFNQIKLEENNNGMPF